VAYLAPAAFIALIARETRHYPAIERGYPILSAAALVLVMVWLTIETKRFFQGPHLTIVVESDAEYYAYSVAWLLASFVLLGVGLWRGTAWLRHGALAIVILTILKVF